MAADLPLPSFFFPFVPLLLPLSCLLIIPPIILSPCLSSSLLAFPLFPSLPSSLQIISYLCHFLFVFTSHFSPSLPLCSLTLFLLVPFSSPCPSTCLPPSSPSPLSPLSSFYIPQEEVKVEKGTDGEKKIIDEEKIGLE